MRKFILVVAVAALLVAAAFVYLKATTPTTSEGVRFPLSARQRALLASVPASAEAFALVPTAAAFEAKLTANPVTRDAVSRWVAEQRLPPSWMFGDADLVIWKSGKQTSYIVRLDPFRASLVRLARVSSGTFLINAGSGQPLGEARLAALLQLSNGFQSADALAIQQGARGAFPPIARPTVTAVKVEQNEVILISRSAGLRPAVPPASSRPAGGRRYTFPRGALLAATFQDPPRAIGDLDRLLGTRISTLLQDGGSVILYGVETGTLLPRPRGLIAVPSTPEKRAAAERIAKIAEIVGEVRDSGGQLLISFDKKSLSSFTRDQFADPTWPGDWLIRVDPKRFVPILEDLGDNAALRIATPRLYRSIRDLRRWIGNLAQAEVVEASHAETPSGEQLRVRISAK